MISDHTKKTYKLNNTQRDSLVRDYAVGGLSYRDLGTKYGIKHHSAWSIVHKSDKFEAYKKENKLILDQAMVKLANKTVVNAYKKANTMSAYQSVVATGILYDKLFPQGTVINVGDNRTMNVTFSNWNNARKPSSK